MRWLMETPATHHRRSHARVNGFLHDKAVMIRIARVTGSWQRTRRMLPALASIYGYQPPLHASGAMMTGLSWAPACPHL